MSAPCPQCGAPAPAGTRLGSTYACPRCKNPVLAVAVPTAPAVAAPVASSAAGPTDRGEASGDPPDAAGASPGHWKMGLLAFVVLGACYVGAYELLTAEAQRERANLLRVHGAAIESFPDPGPSPLADDAKALRDYRPAHERWVDRGRYEALGTRVRAMFLGMLGAFGLQSAVTAVLAWKTLRRRPSARRTPTPK